MTEITQSPEFAALLIAVTGFFIAIFCSRWAVALGSWLRRTLLSVAPLDEDASHRQANDKLLGRIVFYAVLGIFLLLSIRVLGVSVIAEVLDVVLGYVPKLIIGICIILGGYLLGWLTRSLVANLLPVGSTNTIPTIAQYLVVVTAVVTGLSQMQIDVSFIATLLLIMFGALIGSLSLAFSLGSRRSVENILARRELGDFHVGDEIKMAGAEGRILEMTSTGVVLDTEEGRLHIPASLLTAQPVLQKRDKSL